MPWYVAVTGGMQDFNYANSNSFELTLELSCCKYPPASDLPNEWNLNKTPFLHFIASTHRGVRGKFLIDYSTNSFDSSTNMNYC